MVYFSKWKVVLVLAVCILGLVYAAPNLLNRADVERWSAELPGWLPTRTVNLGLDLQGGSHLLLEVQTDVVIQERMNALLDSARDALREGRIGYTDLEASGPRLSFSLRNPEDEARAREIAAGLEPNDARVQVDGSRVILELTEQAIQARESAAVEQSIEIVRRRIDETGTREPSIQRQGNDRILVQLPGIDDPERVKNLLGQTAKMTFRLVDDSVSVTDAQAGRIPPGSELLPSRDGGFEVVRKRVMVSGDTLVDSQPSFQDGQPVVSFRFDSLGAKRFGEATLQNTGRRFAIVLDNEVISAPRINEPILGGSGIISGSFTVESANDLALLLRAGALPAPLTVLEERTVGPGLGADSIAAGQTAAIVGLVLVIIFMALTYGLFGLFADLALVFNIALIFAALSILQATLTLPGIAGIVLTIGMAVDANVLIFERIREEIRNGRTPIAAIDAGYSRALTTIIDSNLTTLIAALLLFMFGSGPVKGFAVTLSIGILASMFTAIMVTRLMVVAWLRQKKPKVVPI
ncbi:protein translocase subunit SecD [Indioceanicola profundi]|uniref:protein translocase subunit SecD n=1 Tax=Indioceanicola profundi TaxID=2220096 RepID=UPI000E6AC1DF|nr:protein translocase subunit SecD [Indioceanicola profundi]